MPHVLMTRRSLLALALGTLASACSPLALLNRLAPRDVGARRIARDLAYGSDPRHRLDIWSPTRPAEKGAWPVLVFFYGGGWNSGERGLYAWAAQALAARGFLVVLPDYRLVPEVRFPAFVEDAAQATAFAGAIAERHGGDPSRLGVLGHSAGAYLAMMIALDRRYMASVDAPDLIRAAAGLAGPYDFLPLDVPASINAFGRAPDPTFTQPVAFVRPDAPPVWLAHGTADTVVEPADSVILCERLRAAGGRCQAKLYEDLSHEDLITTFSPLFRSRAPVLQDVASFFTRALG
jgi:acetyl esterase/lipase